MTKKIEMSIDDVMTAREASDRYSVNIRTLREYLMGNRANVDQEAEIERGAIRFYKAENASRGEWLVTRDFMERVYLPYELPENYEQRLKNWRK